MKSIFLITSIILTLSINVYSQVVNCSRCRGTGKETKQSPYECQNCKNWNAEYRRKVACNVCRDTRVNPNRKSWTETCSLCKGSGRDYAQEARNRDFGGKEFRPVNGAYSGAFSNIQFKSLSIEWREAYKAGVFGNGVQTEFGYNEWSTACSCLGSGWQLPNKSELESISNHLKVNNLLNSTGYGTYASSSETTKGDFNSPVVWTQYLGTNYVNSPTRENIYKGSNTPKAKIFCVKYQNSNLTNQSSNIQSQSTLNSASSGGLRDPQRKDVANVFWNGNYPLYSLVDDLEIKPDASGFYRMWYATNEDKTPRELIMTKGQVKTVYKFRTYEECLKWCRGY
jgi:hypothetical protein